MRLIKTAFAHIRRSPYQAISAISVMTLTFFIASVFLLAAYGSEKVMNFLETKPQVSAYFKDEVTLEEIELLKDKLNKTGKVLKIKFISKEEALSIYREQNKDDPLLLEMVTANILPSSLEVSAQDLLSLKEIAEILKNDEFVGEVVFQEDVVSGLSSWTRALRMVGIALISILSFVSLFNILIIIGMKVALRRKEIEILRLIGASSWYVQAPFFYEGIFYGLTGAVFSWAATYGLLIYTSPKFEIFLQDIPLLPINPLVMLSLLVGLVTAGTVIGVFGSFLAIRRYLK